MSAATAETFTSVSRARHRAALGLTGAMVLIYFGFIGLVAWNQPLMAMEIRPGLSVGLALGLGVIVACWVLTGLHVRWANTRYDPALQRLRGGETG